jgi:tetratricopeptide (TPR) repeat protein
LLGYFDRHRYDAAWLATFTSALSAAQRRRDQPGMAAMCRGLGKLHYMRGEYAQARTHYQRATDAFRSAGDLVGECRTLNGLACVAVETGAYGEAIRQYECALETQRSVQDRVGQADVLVNLGTTLVLIGSDDLAARRLAEAESIAHTLGLAHVHPRVQSATGLSELWRGRLDAAAATFQRALHTWSDLRYRQGRAQTLRNLAEVELEAGRADRASALAQEALALAEEIAAPWVALGAAVTLGQVLLAKEESEAAFERFLYAERLHAVGLQYWTPFTVLGFAACARLDGDPGRAAELATTAADDVRPRVRGQAHLELARAHLALGDEVAAVSYANEAAAIGQRHDYRLDLDRALSVLAEICRRFGSLAQAVQSRHAPESSSDSRRLRRISGL